MLCSIVLKLLSLVPGFTGNFFLSLFGYSKQWLKIVKEAGSGWPQGRGRKIESWERAGSMMGFQFVWLIDWDCGTEKNHRPLLYPMSCPQSHLLLSFRFVQMTKDVFPLSHKDASKHSQYKQITSNLFTLFISSMRWPRIPHLLHNAVRHMALTCP